MYRLLVPALSAVALLAPAAGARAADDDPKAVIVKAIKAHGGEEALTKYQAGQSSNKGKIDVPGLGEVEFAQQLAYMIPDKLKDEMELTVGGQKIRVVTIANGDKISIEANGTAVDVNDQIKDSLKDARHMLRVGRLVALVKEKGHELSAVGEVKVEGKPAVGVRVSTKGEKDINLYFDKESGLLVKIEHRTIAPGTANEITEERIILEYRKDANGIPLPKKVLLNHDGKKFLEAEVDGQLLEKLGDDVFKK
jgi:hypothetical protein